MAELVSDASTLTTITPMMQQYLEIKAQYEDHILMYRLGDFFEMFFSDAVTVSRELELTLTGRDCGGDKRAAMCGVPFHKVDLYIGKLVERGHKVAVCEQVSEPNGKGLVRREIVRVVTPGTVTDGTLLSEGKNNYLAAICYDDHAIGLGFADVSTGQISVTLLEGEELAARLENELAIFAPCEAIINVSAAACGSAVAFLTDRFGTMITDRREDLFEELSARMLTASVFGEAAEGLSHAALHRTVGALLAYIRETQKCTASFVKDLNVYTDGQTMEIDVSTRRNLELTESMRTKEKKGSLLWVLDKTCLTV